MSSFFFVSVLDVENARDGRLGVLKHDNMTGDVVADKLHIILDLHTDPRRGRERRDARRAAVMVKEVIWCSLPTACHGDAESLSVDRLVKRFELYPVAI